MLRVLNCLTTQHDPRLLLLAVAICALGSLTAVYILSRATRTQGLKLGGWAVLAGVATGSVIWSTHFVAMLAFKPGLPVAYDPVLTTASLLIAVFVTSTGFLLAGDGGARWRSLMGGATLGLGISAMHYTGMRALQIPGVIAWDLGLVAASVAFGVVLSMLSMLARIALATRRRQMLTAALLLTLAICTMHFTAMGAAIIVPDLDLEAHNTFVNSGMMAIGVAAVALLVVLAALCAALIDSQSSREALQRLQALANSTIEGILAAKDGVIVDANARVAEMCGLSEAELLGKRVFGDLLDVSGVAREARRERFEAKLSCRGQRTIPVEVMRRPFALGLKADEVYAIRDLSERYAAENRIRYLAHHDAMTGLPNRATTTDKLESALRRARAAKLSFAVICIDLDRFKDVNDMLGHSAGDAVLREAADRIKAELRPGDVLGRLGGDEFIVLQTRRRQPQSAAALAGRLIEKFAAMFAVEGQLVQVGLSVGVAVYPQDGDTADELMGHANIALARAKAEGRGCVRFFDPEIDKVHHHRKRLAHDLRHAVSEGQLELHYQPQLSIPSCELIGFEALLRWRHPEFGMVSPNEFIPMAEETGLILSIGEWVLRTACREAAEWSKPCRVAVNLSPKQFQQADLPQTVHAILLETGLAPARLELEVTETMLFRDFNRVLDILRRLKALGVTVAMDDYGTGYSSLAVLQAFSFDKLKIDRGFVEKLGTGRQADTIVRSVLSLGHSLDVPVLAEGVETQEQLDYLCKYACDEAQGYYFGRPVPAADVRKLLASAESWQQARSPAQQVAARKVEHAA